MFDKIGHWSGFLRKNQTYIVMAFLGVAALLKVLEGLFLADLHASAIGMYFLSPKDWDHLMNAFACKEVIGHFNSYVIIDQFFFVFYGLFLLMLATMFEVKAWRILFVVLIGVLVIADIVENMHLLMSSCDDNCPWASGIKFSAGTAIVVMLLSNWAGRSIAKLHAAFYSLWYCRFSAIGVLLLFVFLQAPQGRELLIYMLESELVALYIVFFAITIFLTTVVIYYMPRFLYPENPDKSPYRFRMVYDFTHWVNHLKVQPDVPESKGFIGEQQKQTLRSQEHEALRRALQQRGAPGQKSLVPIEVNDEDIERLLIRFRKYTPLVLASVFCLMLITAFVKVFFNIGAESNKTFHVDALMLGLRAMVIVFVIMLIASARLRNGLSKGFVRFLHSRAVNNTMLAMLLIAIGLFAYGCVKNEYCWHLLALISLTVGALLLLYSVSHHSGRSRYLTWKHRQSMHRSIISGLYILAIAFLVCLVLTLCNLDFSIGVIVLFLALAFYSAFPFLLSYKGNERGKRTNYFAVFILIALIAVVVSTEIDNNHLDVETMTGQYEAPPLGSFIDRFHKLHEQDTSDAIPVFFIAANGGGTMQAYWTASVIAYLRDNTDYEIDSHIFAMSGASGGAEGMAISVMAWDTDTSMQTAIRNIYNHDYLTGGLTLMFGTDLWASVLPFNMKKLPNRSEWFKHKYGRHLKKYLMHNRWDSPYRDVWRDTSRWLPLYCANTAQVETGERWFSTPFSLDQDKSQSAFKTSGVSLLDSMHRISRDTSGGNIRTLSFGDAVLLSSRFPYISTSGKIDGFGHFVDGGYHDNSGIETLLEVYHAVMPMLHKKNPNYQPHFIHINYGTGAWSNYEVWEEKRNTCADTLNGLEVSESVVPLVAAYGNLLGQSVYNRVERLMNQGFMVHRIYLPGADIFSPKETFVDKPTRDDFQKEIDIRLIETPLGRTISQNQKDFVSKILGSQIQPRAELDSILKAFR